MATHTKEEKKKRGTTDTKEQKRREVVAGVIAGKDKRTIAKDAGTSLRHVQRLVAEPATQLLVTSLFAPHHRKLRNMATRAIEVVQQGLKATSYVRVGKDEYRVRVDTLGRLRAVERFCDLIALAQGKLRDDGPPDTEIGRSYTWEEFTLLQARRVTSAAADNDNP
jgi:hypothetical protein